MKPRRIKLSVASMKDKESESQTEEEVDVIKEPIEVVQQSEESDNLSWFQSVMRVLSNKNWAVYLGTVWIYNSIAVINQYFTLYFRDIGISYILVGVLISVMFIVNAIGTFVAGYLADNYDRRKLSVLTMAVNVVQHRHTGSMSESRKESYYQSMEWFVEEPLSEITGWRRFFKPLYRLKYMWSALTETADVAAYHFPERALIRTGLALGLASSALVYSTVLLKIGASM